MKSALSQIFRNPFLLILLTTIIKLPLFLTKNIQEDSFITWRVARNVLNYGVIGFNGDERIYNKMATELKSFIKERQISILDIVQYNRFGKNYFLGLPIQKKIFIF
jgi:hypothetical protein